ncbi:DUF5634 family protein [Bacillus sp. CGMCC 1.16541]|uniref:DUF5634 family protein n=1 Tax=Bacillus sp. CGMCC 1.16541 TaxID=2185143 RepID=UPI000D736BD0|nr:DUF5634 family protein [Bacillus sp. CGMCC 1.16541]
MVFLSWETVYNDKKRLIGLFEKEYGVSPIELFSEESDSELCYIGYRFKKNGKQISIKVPHLKDHADRYSAQHHKWELLINEKKLGIYKNAKEAFRILNHDANVS